MSCKVATRVEPVNACEAVTLGLIQVHAIRQWGRREEAVCQRRIVFNVCDMAAIGIRQRVHGFLLTRAAAHVPDLNRLVHGSGQSGFVEAAWQVGHSISRRILSPYTLAILPADIPQLKLYRCNCCIGRGTPDGVQHFRGLSARSADGRIELAPEITQLIEHDLHSGRKFIGVQPCGETVADEARGGRQFVENAIVPTRARRHARHPASAKGVDHQPALRQIVAEQLGNALRGTFV